MLGLLGPHPPPGLQSLQVRHLLPQEQDPLLLQRGLDLSQPHQRPRHLEVCRHLQIRDRRQQSAVSSQQLSNIIISSYLGDGVVGYRVGVIPHLVDGSLHLFSRPGQYVAYQLFSVEAGEGRSQLDG